jgi:hypothetical protein
MSPKVTIYLLVMSMYFMQIIMDVTTQLGAFLLLSTSFFFAFFFAWFCRVSSLLFCAVAPICIVGFFTEWKHPSHWG